MKKVIMFDRDEVVSMLEDKISDLLLAESNGVSFSTVMSKREKTYLAGRAEELIDMVDLFDVYINKGLFNSLNRVYNDYSGVL